MSLKNDFNNTLKGLVPKNGKNFIETEFVNALIGVLQSGNYSFVRVKKLHGKTTQFNTGKRNIKREMCDIFLILRYKDHYRFSFIQNKRKLRSYQGLSDFIIDAGQHYFLVKKPDFIYNKKVYSLLKSTKYDTVTAYSVFYIDNNGNYNFDFASANSCICARQNAFCCCNFTEKCKTRHKYTQITCSNNTPINDYVSLKNVDEIENYPYFGEVVYFSDNKINELKCLVSDCAGEEMLSFLEMDNINTNFIPNSEELPDNVQLIIKNIIAVDLRNYERKLNMNSGIRADRKN